MFLFPRYLLGNPYSPLTIGCRLSCLPHPPLLRPVLHPSVVMLCRNLFYRCLLNTPIHLRHGYLDLLNFITPRSDSYSTPLDSASLGIKEFDSFIILESLSRWILDSNDSNPQLDPGLKKVHLLSQLQIHLIQHTLLSVISFKLSAEMKHSSQIRRSGSGWNRSRLNPAHPVSFYASDPATLSLDPSPETLSDSLRSRLPSCSPSDPSPFSISDLSKRISGMITFTMLSNPEVLQHPPGRQVILQMIKDVSRRTETTPPEDPIEVDILVRSISSRISDNRDLILPLQTLSSLSPSGVSTHVNHCINPLFKESIRETIRDLASRNGLCLRSDGSDDKLCGKIVLIWLFGRDWNASDSMRDLNYRHILHAMATPNPTSNPARRTISSDSQASSILNQIMKKPPVPIPPGIAKRIMKGSLKIASWNLCTADKKRRHLDWAISIMRSHHLDAIALQEMRIHPDDLTFIPYEYQIITLDESHLHPTPLINGGTAGNLQDTISNDNDDGTGIVYDEDHVDREDVDNPHRRTKPHRGAVTCSGRSRTKPVGTGWLIKRSLEASRVEHLHRNTNNFIWSRTKNRITERADRYCWIKIPTRRGPPNEFIYLCSIYVSPSPFRETSPWHLHNELLTIPNDSNWIIAGDFNDHHSTMRSDLLKMLIDDWNFIRATPEHLTTFRSNPESAGSCIDKILIRNSSPTNTLTVRKHGTAPPPLSDVTGHIPIWSEMKWRSKVRIKEDLTLHDPNAPQHPWPALIPPHQQQQRQQQQQPHPLDEISVIISKRRDRKTRNLRRDPNLLTRVGHLVEEDLEHFHKENPHLNPTPLPGDEIGKESLKAEMMAEFLTSTIIKAIKIATSEDDDDDDGGGDDDDDDNRMSWQPTRISHPRSHLLSKLLRKKQAIELNIAEATGAVNNPDMPGLVRKSMKINRLIDEEIDSIKKSIWEDATLEMSKGDPMMHYITLSRYCKKIDKCIERVTNLAAMHANPQQDSTQTTGNAHLYQNTLVPISDLHAYWSELFKKRTLEIDKDGSTHQIASDHLKNPPFTRHQNMVRHDQSTKKPGTHHRTRNIRSHRNPRQEQSIRSIWDQCRDPETSWPHLHRMDHWNREQSHVLTRNPPPNVSVPGFHHIHPEENSTEAAQRIPPNHCWVSTEKDHRSDRQEENQERI